MDDENTELDLDNSDQQDETPKENRSESRIKALADQKTKAEKALEKERLERETFKKEAEFYKTFNSQLAKYKNAGEFQDQIKEKVMAGYDMEDATISILARNGKLESVTPPPPPKESPAGGSAVTNITANIDKPITEMSREEKRAKLMENEADLIDLLSPKMRL